MSGLVENPKDRFSRDAAYWNMILSHYSIYINFYNVIAMCFKVGASDKVGAAKSSSVLHIFKQNYCWFGKYRIL